MKAYQYNQDSKIFETEVECQIDPLETEAAGFDVWLLPANSTFKKPLKEKNGFDVCFDVAAEKWIYIEQEKEEDTPYIPTPEEEKQARIYELKSQLQATDYKIIKCSECNLAGEPLPYDIAALHAERQAIRDEINELGQ